MTRVTDEHRAALQLILIPGIGPRHYQLLVAHFQSAVGVLAASEKELRSVPGLGTKLRHTLVQQQQVEAAGQIIDCCQQEQVEILLSTDETYPALLNEIHDPPGILFCRGPLKPPDALSIAIVGMRRPSHYGLQTAYRLAEELSQAGFTIVSGLARGIDAAAHRGALSAGGRTLAVLGSGVLKYLPPGTS